ncbi:MAG: LysR family transcriptional regulator [Gammaproteobacteria bacterium]|jgi:DNA-binding transcriptional LysR family regulator|nr:LysR family transcriptional regulator [Gammaproteobacteria bacterium]
MRNVTLRQMRVFAAVARHLSFTRAARELHLTQPAVSQQVKLLEQEIGLPLFEQIGRKVHLAPAGAELLRYTDQAMELLREAGESLSAMRGLKRGILKLGAVSTAKYFAPSLLSAFTPAYPEVTIKFAVGNREEIIQQLAANEIDLVIMGRPPRELETVAEPFAKHPLVLIASPTHPLACRRRIRLKQLATEHFLIREEGSGTRASMERVFRERGVPFRVSMEVSSNETIKQAVMADMGISFISSHTVGLELAAGKLVVLDVVGLPIVRDWYVIHLRDKRLAPIPTAFRAFLLEHGARIIQKAVGDLPRSRRAV